MFRIGLASVFQMFTNRLKPLHLHFDLLLPLGNDLASFILKTKDSSIYVPKNFPNPIFLIPALKRQKIKYSSVTYD